MNQPESRIRILQAATRLFSERGYEHTKIREIALQAGVNISAVNYHYQSKDALYAKVLEMSARESGLCHLPNRSAAEEQSRGDLARILAWEIVRPHGPSSGIVREVVEREVAAARELVRRAANRPLQAHDERFAGQIMVCVLLFGPFMFHPDEDWRSSLEDFFGHFDGSHGVPPSPRRSQTAD